MTKFNKHLSFNTKEYEDFEELLGELFWNDMNLYELDTICIHDEFNDIFYTIEQRFQYADILHVFELGKNIRFDEVKDEDLIMELKEELLEMF